MNTKIVQLQLSCTQSVMLVVSDTAAVYLTHFGVCIGVAWASAHCTSGVKIHLSSFFTEYLVICMRMLFMKQDVCRNKSERWYALADEDM